MQGKTRRIMWKLGSGSASFGDLCTKKARQEARVRERVLRTMLTTWVFVGRPVERMMCSWSWSWGPDSRKASYMEPRAATLATFSMLDRFSGLVGSISRIRRPRLRWTIGATNFVTKGR